MNTSVETATTTLLSPVSQIYTTKVVSNSASRSYLNDLRSNVGGNNGTGTATVTMAAGSNVKFTADVAVYHQGPVSL
jgi:hypothetical protein